MLRNRCIIELKNIALKTITLFTIDGAQKFSVTADHTLDHILAEFSPKGATKSY